MDDKYALIALVVILAILAVYWAYTQCKLNKYLSPKLQKNCGSFVGSMAQHPQLVPCAFPVSDDWQMNRCNYAEPAPEHRRTRFFNRRRSSGRCPTRGGGGTGSPSRR